MPKSKLGLLVVFLSACASAPRTGDRLSVDNWERINVGADTKTVSEILGDPTEVRRDFKDNPDAVWIYDDENGSQRGAISVSPIDRTVAAVTFIPKEGNPESNVNFLIQKKFASLKFEKVPLQRCGRHFVPFQVFSIDIEKGTTMIAHRETGEVESFSRATPEHAADLLRRIRDCKR